MSIRSKKKMRRLTVLPLQRQGNGALHRPSAGREAWSRDQTGSFKISRELVADRLRCMLEHIHTGDAQQVLLHTSAIAGALTPMSPSVEAMRDSVQEAQGLFLRGDIRLAEETLREALDRLTTNRTKGSRLTLRVVEARQRG